MLRLADLLPEHLATIQRHAQLWISYEPLYEPGPVVARWGWHVHLPELAVPGVHCRWCREELIETRCRFLTVLHQGPGTGR